MIQADIGLYIHFPWCVRKCPYCDFNSHESGNQALYDQYLRVLLQDLAAEQKLWSFAGQLPRISSIFIGGGTPSLASGAFYQTLLNQVKARFPVVNDLEVTMEANPGALEYDRFEHYLEAGINRLSIGAQSFSPQHLQKLGRIHKAEQTLDAYAAARQAGFKRINLDIMFGLPSQTHGQGLADLQTALDLNPEHLSWYQLTIEPNTVFYSKPPQLDLDQAHDLWEAGRRLLQKSGFEQYEVSAYAKPGEQCRHNLQYWRFGDYAAIGAGAHGKITRDTPFRYQKSRLPQHYLDRALHIPTDAHFSHGFISQSQPIDDVTLEFFLNRLRLNTPITQQEYSQAVQNHGRTWQEIQPWLQRQSQRGLMRFSDKHCEVTDLGWAFLDEILADYT